MGYGGGGRGRLNYGNVSMFYSSLLCAILQVFVLY